MTASNDKTGNGYIDHGAAYQAQLEAWTPRLGPDYGGEGPGTRHCSVAYSGDAAAVLRDVLKDNLSPRAVAAIAAYLRQGDPASTDDRVNKEVWWFLDLLTDLVGGYDEQVRLAAEVGL